MTGRLAHLIATGLGVGHLPLVPGTWGSLLALLLAALSVFFVAQPFPLLLGAVVLSSVAGVWAGGRVAADLGESDPSRVVIDEIAGQFLAFLWVPLSVTSLLGGFFLFRAFDILKPSPARQAEALPGGLGIMTDDLVAGAYAGLLLWVLGRLHLL